MPELVPAVPLTPDWHAARRGGVTATDIVTILGLSTRDSVYSLFWRKMGQVPDEPDNDRMRLGRELEPYIMGRWGQEHDDACYDVTGPALYRSTARPWQMATPDSVLYDGEAKETRWGEELPPAAIVGVLECKTWADADRRTWDDGPPARVRAQVLWQMDVMDVARGHVGVVFLPSGEFRSYTIEHPLAAEHDVAKGMEWAISGDSSLLCSVCYDIMLMRRAGEEFMARLRLELPPPDPDSSAATLAAVRARFTKVPAKQAEVDSFTYKMWLEMKDQADRCAELARYWESQLREQAGEASVLCVDGQPVARRVIVDAQVKAHVRRQDYLKRIKQEGDDDA